MFAGKSIMVGAAALALVAGGTAAGAAIASGPVGRSGVIDGCYSRAALHGSHLFALQNQGTACPKGTTAVSWNRSGPAGPAGPTGPAGPSTAGPNGLDVIEVGSTFAGSGTVTCPVGNPYLISGFADDDTAASTAIYIPTESTAGYANGVYAQLTPEEGGPSGSDVLAIWALCSK